MFKYLKQDMADPDMRGHAMTKVAGMSAVSLGIYALQDAALRAFDVDEDEHEAIRLMSPTWSENSNILPTGRDDDGNLEYIDLTYLDPYAYFKKPINGLMRDQPADDAIIQAIKEILRQAPCLSFTKTRKPPVAEYGTLLILRLTSQRKWRVM